MSKTPVQPRGGNMVPMDFDGLRQPTFWGWNLCKKIVKRGRFNLILISLTYVVTKLQMSFILL